MFWADTTYNRQAMTSRDIHIVKVFDKEPDVQSVCSLAGRNNLLPRLPQRYLYLRSFGTMRKGGKWHCDMFFTPLEKLQAPRQQLADAVNWRAWLGEGWEVAQS
jgi:hypothetical protein